METPIQAEPKKSNTGLIIGIVVVVLVLCCCCLLIAGAVGYSRYQAASAFSSINGGLPTTSGGAGSNGTGGAGGLGTTTNIPGIPSGGKADDAQRTTAYGYVVIAAAMDGCSSSGPKADAIKIAVTKDADASGNWEEEWTVTCDSGSSKTYTVAFPSGDENVSNIKVTAK